MWSQTSNDIIGTPPISARASGSSTKMKVSFHSGSSVFFTVRVRALKGPNDTLQTGSEEPPMSAPRTLCACSTCNKVKLHKHCLLQMMRCRLTANRSLANLPAQRCPCGIATERLMADCHQLLQIALQVRHLQFPRRGQGLNL